VPRSAAALILTIAGVAAGAPAAAQNPEPPGPYIIDVRGAMGGLPKSTAFYPPISSDTLVPARGFGFEVGAHVYFLRLGPARLGLGATLLRVRGTANTPAPETTASQTTTVATSSTLVRPDLVATFTAFAPQLSLNFGTAEGWSYLSAGLGPGRVRTTASADADATVNVDTTYDSGTLSDLNLGAGARWFLATRVAVAFDLRVHMLSAGGAQANAPGTPKSTLFVASVGFSVR
jgi:hypothetical protein